MRRAATRATVVGAGVAGLAAARELSRAGAETTVIDRAAGPGPDQCSWWAGGMLAPWCERESAEDAVIALGRDAADWWDEAAGGVVRNGTLVVAPNRDRGELRRFARRTGQFETVGEDRIAALEPDLAGRFREALFFPREAHLNPRETLHRLTARLAADGVAVRFGVETPPGSGLIVDCRGLAAADRLPQLRGVKGETLLIRTSEIALRRPVRLLHPRHSIYLVPRKDGLFMLGATMIESADRSRVTVRSALELLGAAYALHPAFAEAEIVETGADARPAYPDNLPRVTRRDGRIWINGLYRHGFLLAPAMAREAARVALGAAAERAA